MLKSNGAADCNYASLQVYDRDDPPHGVKVETGTLRAAALVAGTGILLICFFGGYGEIMRQRAMQDLGIDVYSAGHETLAPL